jgi:hypothetical protein
MFLELTSIMIPIENLTEINSFSQIIGEKWTRRLNLDKIDLSKIGH